MRGSDQQAGALFSYVDLDRRVRADHPLRVIRKIVNEVLADLSGDFEARITVPVHTIGPGGGQQLHRL